MKKKLFALLLALFAFPTEVSADTTLIHATDLHYIAPELTDNGAYFTKLIENADGKTMTYSEELVSAFVDDVISRTPDALILSGDLTFNGAAASHRALAKKLARVRENGIPVLVLPGNHDLYSRSAARFSGDGYTRTDGLTAEEFAEIYADFGFRDAVARDENSLSYVSEITPRLRILMLDANTQNAPCALTSETLAFAHTQLKEAKRLGIRVIAVSHQNLFAHSSMIFHGFVMQNAEALLPLLQENNVRLSLSGHMHMQHSLAIGGVTEVATQSLAVSPNPYAVLTIDENTADYQTVPIDVAAWAARNGSTNPDLLNFSAYTAQFFARTAIEQVLSALGERNDAQEMAAYFARINACYFTGRMDLFEDDPTILEKWRAQKSFLGPYIVSIAEEKPRNHAELRIPL